MEKIFNHKQAGRILFLLIILANLIYFVPLSAQAPAKISYQAVVRDASNNLLINQQVGLLISILSGSVDGAVVFMEVHNPNPQTNSNGLLNIEIGAGTPLTGTLSGIDWANDMFFLKTEIDPAGGTNYTIAGTTQLLSVPYAFHAQTAESLVGSEGIAPSGPAGGDLSGTYPNPQIMTNAVTAEKIDENAVTSQKIADNAVNTTKIADNAISTAKIADHSITIAKLPAGATNTAFLRGDGTWASPAEGPALTLPFDGTTNTGTFGLRVGHTATSGNNFGIHAQSASISGRGIYGGAIASSGATFGVRGESISSEGTGVFGWAVANTGTTYGVRGQVTSSDGFSGHFTGGKFHVDGNVGIGDTNPTQKLDVNGQVRIRGGNPGLGKILTSSTDGTATWEASNWLLNGTTLMNNNTTGMVQIVSSASNPLRIEGGNQMYASIFENGTYLGYFGSYSGAPNDVDFGTGAFSGAKTHLTTRASPRLTVDQNGNVGIGTQNPTTKLDVAGNISLSGNLNRPETGSSNLIPVAYGLVDSFGGIQPANTGNFSAERVAQGRYEISISGHNYHIDNYITVCTIQGTTPGFVVQSSFGNKLIVWTFNSSGNPTNLSFSFVSYKK